MKHKKYWNLIHINPKEPAVNPIAMKKENSNKSLLPVGIETKATEIR